MPLCSELEVNFPPLAKEGGTEGGGVILCFKKCLTMLFPSYVIMRLCLENNFVYLSSVNDNMARCV